LGAKGKSLKLASEDQRRNCLWFAKETAGRRQL